MVPIIYNYSFDGSTPSGHILISPGLCHVTFHPDYVKMKHIKLSCEMRKKKEVKGKPQSKLVQQVRMPDLKNGDFRDKTHHHNAQRRAPEAKPEDERKPSEEEIFSELGF
jgi:hypothetical protein